MWKYTKIDKLRTFFVFLSITYIYCDEAAVFQFITILGRCMPPTQKTKKKLWCLTTKLEILLSFERPNEKNNNKKSHSLQSMNCWWWWWSRSIVLEKCFHQKFDFFPLRSYHLITSPLLDDLLLLASWRRRPIGRKT